MDDTIVKLRGSGKFVGLKVRIFRAHLTKNSPEMQAKSHGLSS